MEGAAPLAPFHREFLHGPQQTFVFRQEQRQRCGNIRGGMNRLLRSSACAVCAVATAGVVWGADAETPKPALAPVVPIVKAVQPAVIDGVLDDACWKAATPVPVDVIKDKQGKRRAQPPMTVRYAWDEHYLYIGYETFDTNLVAVGTGTKEGLASNQREGCEIWKEGYKADVVEFFISLGDEHFFWEIHHNASNQFNDVWCTALATNWPISQSALFRWGIVFGAAESLQDEGPFTLAMGSHVKPKADGQPSTVNDPSDIDTGYTAEIRLPWYALGAPLARQAFWDIQDGDKTRRIPIWKMAGHEVRILAVFQDGDLQDRYHHSSPTLTSSWFHTGWADWPRYVPTEP